MDCIEYENRYKVLRKLGKTFPKNRILAEFDTALREYGFEAVGPFKRQLGSVVVEVNACDYYFAAIYKYNKKIMEFPIFPTSDDIMKLGIEVGKILGKEEL